MALKWLRRRHKTNSPLARQSHFYKTASVAATASAAIPATAAVAAAAPAIAGAGGMARAGIVAAGAMMLSGVGDIVDRIARPRMIAG
jgi:hypothetical protein